MFGDRKSSFRKNMAFLVCVCFVSMAFPEVTHAATKPSSERFLFPEKAIRLISTTFSFIGLNLPTPTNNSAIFYSLSTTRPKLPKQAIIGLKQKGSISSHGNSTSQKKPKSKDDD